MSKMKCVLYFFVISFLFTSCLSTYSFSKMDNNDYISKKKSPYAVKQIDDFTIEVSGFNSKYFHLMSEPYGIIYRKSVALVNDNIGLETTWDERHYYSPRKINSVRIISECQMFFDSFEVTEDSLGGRSADFKFTFKNLSFGKTKKQIEKEKEEQQFKQAKIEKQQSASAMDNFLGIKFGKVKSEVISEMSKKGYTPSSQSENGNNSVVIFNIEEYATTKPDRVEFHFYSDVFYKASLVYEDINERRDELNIFDEVIKEKFCLEHIDTRTLTNPLRERYVFSDIVTTKNVQSSYQGMRAKATIFITTISFYDKILIDEEKNIEQAEKKKLDEKRKNDMFKGI